MSYKAINVLTGWKCDAEILTTLINGFEFNWMKFFFGRQ